MENEKIIEGVLQVMKKKSVTILLPGFVNSVLPLFRMKSTTSLPMYRRQKDMKMCR